MCSVFCATWVTWNIAHGWSLKISQSQRHCEKPLYRQVWSIQYIPTIPWRFVEIYINK